MDDGRQVFHEQHSQLILDRFLKVVTDEGYRVEGRGNFELFEWIVPEDNRNALLFREDQYYEARQSEL